MFTGIVEEIGIIQKIKTLSGGKQFLVKASRVLEDLSAEDSIAINGVCLTATDVEQVGFTATAVEETLKKSTLDALRERDSVNLERAMKMNGRLGGHIVQGHVDGVGKVVSITKKGTGSLFKIDVPDTIIQLTVSKGSIAIDGISLTIAEIEGNQITVAVIPFTMENTNMGSLKPGMNVNLESDIIGKYVQKLLHSHQGRSKMDEQWLRSMGY